MQVHGLQTSKEQRGGTRSIADRLDKAGYGNDWHVLIQGPRTGRPQLHPDRLGDCCLGRDHGLKMRAVVCQLCAAALHVSCQILHAWHKDDQCKRHVQLERLDNCRFGRNHGLEESTP